MSAWRSNTLLIETDGPDPLLLNSISRIRMIAAKHAGAPTADFNSGAAAIGTGAFVLRGNMPGSVVQLARHDG